MALSKAKVVTVFVLAIGTVVLVITALCCRKGLLEHWYLHELRSGEKTQMIRAAKKLRDMGALHSVPELFHAYARELERNGIPSPASSADRFPYRIISRLHFLKAYPSVQDVFPEFQDRDLESAAAIS